MLLLPISASGTAHSLWALASVSPFLDHLSAPPQAWQFAPLYSLARGPVFGAFFR